MIKVAISRDPVGYLKIIPVSDRVAAEVVKKNGLDDSSSIFLEDEFQAESFLEEFLTLKQRTKVAGGLKAIILVEKWLYCQILHNQIN